MLKLKSPCWIQLTMYIYNVKRRKIQKKKSLKRVIQKFKLNKVSVILYDPNSEKSAIYNSRSIKSTTRIFSKILFGNNYSISIVEKKRNLFSSYSYAKLRNIYSFSTLNTSLMKFSLGHSIIIGILTTEENKGFKILSKKNKRKKNFLSPIDNSHGKTFYLSSHNKSLSVYLNFLEFVQDYNPIFTCQMVKSAPHLINPNLMENSFRENSLITQFQPQMHSQHGCSYTSKPSHEYEYYLGTPSKSISQSDYFKSHQENNFTNALKDEPTHGYESNGTNPAIKTYPQNKEFQDHETSNFKSNFIPRRKRNKARMYHVTMNTRKYWRVEWISQITNKRVYKHYGETKYGSEASKNLARSFFEDLLTRLLSKNIEEEKPNSVFTNSKYQGKLSIDQLNSIDSQLTPLSPSMNSYINYEPLEFPNGEDLNKKNIQGSNHEHSVNFDSSATSNDETINFDPNNSRGQYTPNYSYATNSDIPLYTQTLSSLSNFQFHNSSSAPSDSYTEPYLISIDHYSQEKRTSNIEPQTDIHDLALINNNSSTNSFENYSSLIKTKNHSTTNNRNSSKTTNLHQISSRSNQRVPGRIYLLNIRNVLCWRAEWYDPHSGKRKTRQFAETAHGPTNARLKALEVLVESQCVPDSLLEEARMLFNYEKSKSPMESEQSEQNNTRAIDGSLAENSTDTSFLESYSPFIPKQTNFCTLHESLFDENINENIISDPSLLGCDLKRFINRNNETMCFEFYSCKNQSEQAILYSFPEFPHGSETAWKSAVYYACQLSQMGHTILNFKI